MSNQGDEALSVRVPFRGLPLPEGLGEGIVAQTRHFFKNSCQNLPDRVHLAEYGGFWSVLKR